MTAVTLRDATRKDFDELLAEPLPFRVRAFAADRIDETGATELLGAGGLAFVAADTVAAFLVLKPGSSRFKVALHKAGLKTLQTARELGIGQVVALADENIAAAEPWLARLGFAPTHVRGETVWIWKDT